MEDFVNFTARDDGNISYNISDEERRSRRPPPSPDHPELLIICYAIIFILSVLGNMIVIITLTCNKRMRDIVNVFLLNLVSLMFH